MKHQTNHLPHLRVSKAVLAILAVQGCSAVDDEHIADDEILVAEQPRDAETIAVGFNGDALMVVLSDRGPPRVEHVTTALPVMSFFGESADKTAIAYSTLAGAPTGADSQRRLIDHATAKHMSIDDLVPTGELIVETKDGHMTQIPTEGRFVVSASWSPLDPTYLSYSYVQEQTTGVTVVDVETGELVSETTGDFVVDHILWSDDGGGLLVYELEHPTDLTMTDVVPEEGEGPVRVRPLYIGLDGTELRLTSTADARATLQPLDYTTSESEGTPFAIRLRSDLILRGEDLLGPSMVRIGDDGESVRVDRIAGWNEHGLVHVSYRDDVTELHVARILDGTLQDLVLPPTQAAVTYYLPFASGTSVVVTQVGASVSGGGCSVSSHTAGSTMAYALDLQVSGGSDSVVASAAGTIAGYFKTGSSNCYDSAGCAIYNAACSCSSSCSGYGWGNYVIVAHADGTWTKATHLQSGTVKPTSTGKSVARGCHLANEGGTGKTLGNKNGCGDHVHFQRQTSSLSSGPSTGISFADAAIGSGSCWASYAATTGGMSCAI